jgi:hypothetical protein
VFDVVVKAANADAAGRSGQMDARFRCELAKRIGVEKVSELSILPDECPPRAGCGRAPNLNGPAHGFGVVFSSPRTLLMAATEHAFLARVNVSAGSVNCRF